MEELNKDNIYIFPNDTSSNIFRQYRDHNGFLRTIAANEFIKIWKHYDKDGNGHIEGYELDELLVDLIISIIPVNYVQMISKVFFNNFKSTFMNAYDENSNGRIEVKELAQLIPLEKSFGCIFDNENYLKSSVYFMKLWKKYDVDQSGFIDSSELISLLKDFYHKVKKTNISETKLNEISNIVLEIFDSNKDGKLQIDELSKLFPVSNNYLRKLKLFRKKKLKSRTIRLIFDKYDVDGNGTIENEELDGLLKDLMELQKEDYELELIDKVKKFVLESCDLNKDGRISKKELLMILNTVLDTQRKKTSKNMIKKHFFTCVN